MAPQAACVHEGGGVERRAAYHERERQRRQREAAGGSTEPAAEEATDVEAVSAADLNSKRFFTTKLSRRAA